MDAQTCWSFPMTGRRRQARLRLGGWRLNGRQFAAFAQAHRQPLIGRVRQPAVCALERLFDACARVCTCKRLLREPLN